MLFMQKYHRCTCAACMWQCIMQDVLAAASNSKGCGKQLDSTHFKKMLPTIVKDIIENLTVKCKHDCRLPVKLKDLQQHEEACNGLLEPPATALVDITLGEVMSVPLNEPLSPDEAVVCTRLVKCAYSGGKCLVLRTGGQVWSFVMYTTCMHMYKHNAYTKITEFSVSTHRCATCVLIWSIRPKKRRRDDIVQRRQRLSGGAEDAQTQLIFEIRALAKEDRQKNLAEAGVTIEINATQSLAIKAEHAIPWYRLRILRT